MKLRTRIAFHSVAILFAAAGVTLAQTPTTTPPPEAQAAASAAVPSAAGDPALLAQLTALRDSFIADVKAAGYTPRLPAPTILVDNTPSFGQYEDKTNTLHIAAWSKLSPEDQARFNRVAEARHSAITGEHIFDEAIHHWVFVHELGHWWQACQGKIGGDHWDVEYGANRIAAAYWRTHDPAVLEHTVRNLKTVTAMAPNPLPDGQDMKQYFNANYEKLGPTPAYRWFQGEMILQAVAEIPLPSFKDALANPA